MLSFIIPTLNEERNIKNLFRRLRPQLREGDEIIVVDSYSKDRTVKIAKEQGAKVVMQPKSGIGLAKTAGAKSAKNDILVFMDADCVIPSNFSERIREHFADPKIVAVGGPGLYHSDSRVWKTIYNTYSWGVFYLGKLIHTVTGKYWIPSNNCAFRKETFFIVRGYRSVVCEDTDMMLRLPPSKNVVYDSNLKLTLSERRFKEEGFFRTIALWGWSNVLAFFGDGKSTEGYRTD
jgi:glycosyltransferase involved in cell wall biosynthesis